MFIKLTLALIKRKNGHVNNRKINIINGTRLMLTGSGLEKNSGSVFELKILNRIKILALKTEFFHS